jgi:hypothetical protein
VQPAVFDNFGEGQPHPDETAKIPHVCEVASANRKAFPFLYLPHAPHWNNTRWILLYLMAEYLSIHQFAIAVLFSRLGLHTELEFLTSRHCTLVYLALKPVQWFTASVEASLVCIGEVFNCYLTLQRDLMQFVDGGNLFAVDLHASIRSRFMMTMYPCPAALAFLLHPGGRQKFVRDCNEVPASLQCAIDPSEAFDPIRSDPLRDTPRNGMMLPSVWIRRGTVSMCGRTRGMGRGSGMLTPS